MDEPWKIYYEELHERAADVAERRFDRADDMAEAAHEAYEAVVDRLVGQLDWDEGEALTLTRSFGRAVKEWIAEESWDFDDLREKLEASQHAWDGSAGVG